MRTSWTAWTRLWRQCDPSICWEPLVRVTALHPRRPESSATLTWQPHNLHLVNWEPRDSV
jgi:hypothetical protein